MADDSWAAILARIGPHSPVDLDEDGVPNRPAPPFPDANPDTRASGLPPAARLWDRAPDGPPCIGVRVSEPLAQPWAFAARLAAAAVERGVVPIILTTIGNSGLEHFGFRIERLAHGELQAECEVELARFWNLAIIIDAADAALLG
ncbi:MAG: hypothetical protein JSR87_02205 [Proteobacteria bacterium]|nr:hypothetical protein [Pseudomonadota bacterium]MBS0573473.1 hypothetical protein [Pseudomonadota bacterium]